MLPFLRRLFGKRPFSPSSPSPLQTGKQSSRHFSLSGKDAATENQRKHATTKSGKNAKKNIRKMKSISMQLQYDKCRTSAQNFKLYGGFIHP